ncbi:hypothetical protein [Actinokineospora iranica]|uniref:Uncharacterized protein n=1 Tax=Actinokineospora iranica TaxID=1271860 RepID=A0A1G6J1K7_9PSEU|nr:hypothetical protein [Actinokineospora iranica]SDC11866.1 hypothetical protein SAMN05216174_101166 [Actinokineospora iranica]
MAITAAPTHMPVTLPVRPLPAATPEPERLGARLQAAIARALARPSAAEAELRAGLAWTAARGETCRITGPVGDVRRAIEALRADDAASARVALRDALIGLRDAPFVPVPRAEPRTPRRRSK